VAEFVDQTHGEERAGVVGACGICVGAARLVQRGCQLAASGYVGEDDVAGVGEELIVDLGCWNSMSRCLWSLPTLSRLTVRFSYWMQGVVEMFWN
jgi:hypothetical protein